MKQTILSALRHLLTAVGAIAVARGYVTDSQMIEIAGAVVGLTGALWGAVDEYIAEHKAPTPPAAS